MVGLTPTDDHRRVYDLIVNKHPHGLTRDELAAKSGLGDRKMRAIIEDLRKIAAENAHPRLGPLVLGFDPQTERYTYARTVEQAERIMGPQESRIKNLATAWRAQQKAAEHLGRRAPPTVQDALLVIERTRSGAFQ